MVLVARRSAAAAFAGGAGFVVGTVGAVEVVGTLRGAASVKFYLVEDGHH